MKPGSWNSGSGGLWARDLRFACYGDSGQLFSQRERMAMVVCWNHEPRREYEKARQRALLVLIADCCLSLACNNAKCEAIGEIA